MNYIFSVTLVALLPILSSAQPGLYTINYKVSFNQRFDQDASDIRLFDATLRIHDAIETDYFMVANELKKTSGDNIEIEQDTLWRVRTNLDQQELFFDDIFNEKLTSRWYADSLFPMRWTILPDKTYIDSFYCTKAVCSFRGRKYEAWYCSSISLPFGPWKFGGLPGLIVSVSDSASDLQIRLVNIKRTHDRLITEALKARSYKEYLQTGNRVRKMMKLSARNSDCIDCETKVKFHSWEKVFAE
ncbi:MAG: GLPGLI family protein [Chitinophagaceae bacterium]